MACRWEALAFADVNIRKIRYVGFMRKLRAALAYARACRMYRRNGFPESKVYLLHLQQRFCFLETQSTAHALYLARRHLVLWRIIGRVMREDPACLSASVSLTAGLIALGLKARLILGKGTAYLSEQYDFHAWVEIDGTPVYEAPQVQKRFTRLLEIPNWPVGEV